MAALSAQSPSPAAQASSCTVAPSYENSSVSQTPSKATAFDIVIAPASSTARSPRVARTPRSALRTQQLSVGRASPTQGGKEGSATFEPMQIDSPRTPQPVLSADEIEVKLKAAEERRKSAQASRLAFRERELERYKARIDVQKTREEELEAELKRVLEIDVQTHDEKREEHLERVRSRASATRQMLDSVRARREGLEKEMVELTKKRLSNQFDIISTNRDSLKKEQEERAKGIAVHADLVRKNKLERSFTSPSGAGDADSASTGLESAAASPSPNTWKVVHSPCKPCAPSASVGASPLAAKSVSHH